MGNRVLSKQTLAVVAYYRTHGHDFPASKVAIAFNITRNAAIGIRWRHRALIMAQKPIPRPLGQTVGLVAQEARESCERIVNAQT